MRFARPILLLFLFPALASSPASPKRAQPSVSGVHVEMNNVLYHFSPQIVVHIETLKGELVATKAEGIPVFDDPASFRIMLSHAEIGMTTNALSHVLNEYVFAAHDAPLKEIAVSAEGQTLKIKGKLRGKGSIPFETDGTLSPTPDGLIRIQAKKVKAAKIPVKGLMDLLGVKIAGLVNTNRVRGIRGDGNDLVLDPAQVFPPPHIQGRVTAIYIAGNQIIQVFGSKTGKPAPQLAGNYMAYRGGQLSFGKLTMTETDMVLIDMDPGDPFNFYLDHYKEQLAAGYTKITLQFGLRVFMRDFDKIRKRSLPPGKAQNP